MPETSDSKPVPDPTLLTTQQLYREIHALKELFEARLAAVEYNAAIEKQSVVNQIEHLKILHGERFGSVGKQFELRDRLAAEAQVAQKDAVAAALQAQKEQFREQNSASSLAISKSESATDKRIEQFIASSAATDAATNDKIDDIKQRLQRIEGEAAGARTVVDDHRANWALVISAVAIFTAFAAALITGYLHSH